MKKSKKQIDADYYQRNRKKILRTVHDYYEANKEKIAQYKRKWWKSKQREVK